MNIKRLLNVEIKTTNICNMKCEYCYTPNFQKSERISEKDLINAYSYTKMLSEELNCNVQFLWHGGEPILMGIPFYKKAIESQKKYFVDSNVLNFLQTNGLEINDQYLDYFYEQSFILGISLDGPAILHDKLRIDNFSKPTYERVIDSCERINLKHLPLVVNCVLRKESLEYLDEIYSILKSLQAFATFNILLPPKGDIQIGNSFNYLSPNEYGESIIYLFTKWLHDNEYNALLDTYNYILWSHVYNQPFGCFKAECPNYHRAFTANGQMFMCGRFYGWKNNMLKLNRELQSTFKINDEINSMFSRIKCNDCIFSNLCQGGCYYNRLVFDGSIKYLDRYSKSYLKISDFIFNNREKIVDRFNKIIKYNQHSAILNYVEIE